MGQAKQRKERDPLYGNYRNTVRGLIITTPISIKGDSISISHARLDPQELRSNLLYWDRLLLPTTNFVTGYDTEDLSFLKSCGILETPTFNINGAMTTEIAALPWKALAKCESDAPGVWSVGEGINSIHNANDMRMGRPGCQIQLYNALPTPSEDVPLSEILEFRRKRRAELLAFRSHMDNMIQEIEGSSDSEEGLKIKLKELDKTCANLASVCKEWQTPFKLTNVKATFNLNLEKAIGSAVSTWITLGKVELNTTTKAIASGIVAVSSQFKLEREYNWQSIKRKGSPFKFLYEAQKNLTLK